MKKKDMILIVAVLAISLISFAAIKMTQKDGKEVTVSASIGIALVEEGITFESLYERADRALYEVKNKHRNQYWIA